MFRYSKQANRVRAPFSGLAVLATCVALIAVPPAAAQAPAATGSAAQAIAPDELMTLVGPIALYPDDLVALILPASTFPLQVVQVDRFLAKRKTDSTLQLDERWDDSVKSLANYPEVIKRMSDDLDWTTSLGEAVVANQSEVLDAVQAFRRKAHAAGNLKSDPKQVIEVEREVIKIVPADPQVIYVPQYNPTTVVAYSSYPAYGYYPAPYPSYYYPYPPGAALATGLIFGAAIGAAWNGGHYGADWHGDNNITINRSANVSGSFNRGQTQRGQATAWRSDKRPGQVSSGAGRTQSARYVSARPGDPDRFARSPQRTSDFAGGQRASTPRTGGAQGTARGGRDSSGYSRASAGSGRDSGYSRGGGGYSGDALGGYRSGSATRADSTRGATSRTSMSSRGGASFQGARGGGGGRSGFSGGGRRGGGGGRR